MQKHTNSDRNQEEGRTGEGRTGEGRTGRGGRGRGGRERVGRERVGRERVGRRGTCLPIPFASSFPSCFHGRTSSKLSHFRSVNLSETFLSYPGNVVQV